MNSHTDRQRDRRNTPPGVQRQNWKTTASGHLAGATRYRLQRTGALRPLQEGQGHLPTTPTGDLSARPPESYTGLRKEALSETKRKTEKSLPVADDSPDRSSPGAGGRSRMSPQILCSSREISQWPPGSRYPMQKQQSFYYQARTGAPTDTDAAAIGRSPELWVTLLI